MTVLLNVALFIRERRLFRRAVASCCGNAGQGSGCPFVILDQSAAVLGRVAREENLEPLKSLHLLLEQQHDVPSSRVAASLASVTHAAEGLCSTFVAACRVATMSEVAGGPAELVETLIAVRDCQVGAFVARVRP